MKASPSLSSSSSLSFSTFGHLFIMIILIVLLIFVTSSTSTAVPDASPTTSLPELQLHPCDALTHETSRSLCIHLHRVYQHRLPVHVLPPLLTRNEIDPRYGVEKRLVPSGPNPLHN